MAQWGATPTEQSEATGERVSVGLGLWLGAVASPPPGGGGRASLQGRGMSAVLLGALACLAEAKALARQDDEVRTVG